MYLHGFEGSWLNHPFWRRRFLLEKPADLTALLDSDVIGVLIDTTKGLDLDIAPPAEPPRAEYRPPVREKLRRYAASPTTPLHGEDIARAEAVRTVNGAKHAIRGVLDGARLGKAVETKAVLAVVDNVSAAVEKNRAALLKVLRLKTKDEYTYLHSVAVCALMVALARQLDLDAQTTADLGTAGLLHDIGKMAVPLDVLNKPAKLTDEEFALMQTHPEKGHRLLERSGDLPPMALDVCRHHHEKIDGTGYPHRLRGTEISLAARMGAICDVYDALTSNRAYKAAWSPVEAVTRMREWDGQFDHELLFAFMKVVGIFPPGTFVRLRTNRLGVVVDNGPRSPRPKVLAFYSTIDRRMIDPVAVSIGDDLAHDAILGEADPAEWAIDATVIHEIASRHARG
ncbi:HD-GYP domain-containing protein [Sphingomonas antarctica]